MKISHLKSSFGFSRSNFIKYFWSLTIKQFTRKTKYNYSVLNTIFDAENLLNRINESIDKCSNCVTIENLKKQEMKHFN